MKSRVPVLPVLALLVILSPRAGAILDVKSLLVSQTKTEQRLSAIGGDIIALANSGIVSARNDERATRLFEKGRRIWAASPANSASTFSVTGSGAYEVEILVQAIVDYYTLTGRTGHTIGHLVDAAEEARSLRYYDAWRQLTLQLVQTYRRLGLLDHADERLAALLEFMSRLGFSLDALPEKMDADAIVFVQLHALRLTTNADAYDDRQVKALFDFYLDAVDNAPAAWGWHPRSGFGYIEYAAPFLQWFATFGEDEAFEDALTVYRKLRARNVQTDPLRLADELGINFVDSQLGRDIHHHLNTRFSQLTTFRDGLDSFPPEHGRYRILSPFEEALDLARALLAHARIDDARDQVTAAEAAMPAIASLYDRIPARYELLDRHALARMNLTRTKARVEESLERPAEAYRLYRQYIAWSELERSSLPLEERLHFFRGQARAAYLGAIRAAADLYRAAPDESNFVVLLNAIEALRARQFQEVLRRDAGSEASLDLTELRRKLLEGAGIIVFQDTGNSLLTILLTRDDRKVNRIPKSDAWDRHVFTLRNNLAERADYDEAGFTSLGAELLGFAEAEIDALDRLYIVTDGALSSIPPSILQLRPGKLLANRRVLTLLPSLRLWQDSPASGTRSSNRLFVVADPVFDKERRQRQIGERLLATTRGSDALSYFARLPETLDEARSITTSFSADSKMIHGAQAVESIVKASSLDRYSHLHFATHGIIGNDIPGLTEPALVLGYEEDEDGFLFASEVAGLHLDAELTVLSACNTGNGEYFNGEGLMGMGRAFMLAGSKRVIVSLWPVESLSTLKLMELLYEYMGEGATPEEALARAQLTLRGTLADTGSTARGIEMDTASATDPPATVAVDNSTGAYDHPYYWSPFVLISTR